MRRRAVIHPAVVQALAKTEAPPCDRRQHVRRRAPRQDRAWAIAADPHAGTRLPGRLVANTLDELRAMLPAGLTRTDRSAVMGPDVLEVWV